MSGLDIMRELLKITREMSGSEDTDFLIASLDRRDRLMQEYDSIKAASPESIEKDRKEIDLVKFEIMQFDKEVGKTFHKLQSQVKEDLKNNNSQKKVMGYTNQAMSASGSYMDFKK